MNKDSKILIIGLGLIGGSYAKKLSEMGFTVYGIDNNIQTIDYALTHGLISQGSTEYEFIDESDLIILGVYPSLVKTILYDIKDFIKQNTIITDVSGVKNENDDLNELLINGEFIASHPMAGKEKRGIENHDSTMFLGANFIITPYNNTNYAISTLEQLGSTLGFGKITVLTSKKHNEVIAYTSQLTHVIAVSLINANHDNDLFNYIGDSFENLTRIAKINEDLWSELFISNKEALMNQIDNFLVEMQKMKTLIETSNELELKHKFISSTKRRTQLEQNKKTKVN